VLCSKCRTNLPDGSQSCPWCGTTATTGNSIALAIAPPSVCAKCGTSLPEGSQFCLKCGHSVSPDSRFVVAESLPEPKTEIKTEAIAPPVVQIPEPLPRPPLARPRRRRSRVLWYLIPLLLGATWLSFSNDPIAQQLRDEITGARTQTIVEAPVSVKPQNFAYYEFTVPPGAVNVGVTGQFTTEGRPDKKGNNASDNNIETYVLTDSAFVVWRNGYTTGSRYESDRVPQGTIYATLPAGSGIYYLVFNNRFSQRTEKTVHATVLLHYQTWAPLWLLRMKERLWNWFGLI
jgi:ribosomal protein L40E